MSSCASTTYLNNGPQYVTRVNHFGNYDVKGKTFYFESGDDLVSSNDVEFKEYAGYYAENLKIKGAKETMDKENADICILMNYCITDESYQETIPVPDFGKTTIASAKTEGSKTTFEYNYGKTGYHYVQNNVSKFVRVINVYAYDNKSREGEPIMLWKTNFKSSGSSSDLRRVIPYMIFTNSSNTLTYKDDPNLHVVLENDIVFKRWKRGELSNSNCFLNDAFKYNRKDGCGFIAYNRYVEKRNDEILYCITKTGCQSYKISPELFLVCDGQQIKISYAENYKLGSFIKKECGERDIVLHFPISNIDINNINSFEIREYTNSRHTDYKTWGIVEFTR